MTNVVQVTIDLGGRYLSQFQQVYGQIISDSDDYIMFKDAESDENEKPHKILKRKITKIDHYVPTTNTPVIQGG